MAKVLEMYKSQGDKEKECQAIDAVRAMRR
jgi:hypothetical protein